MKCKKCGLELFKGSKFCSNCGAEVVVSKIENINELQTKIDVMEENFLELKKTINSLNSKLDSISNNGKFVENLDDCKSNPFINYEKEINNIDFNKTTNGQTIPENQRLNPEVSSILREILLGLINATKVVGGVVIEYGKKILDIVIEKIHRFQNVATGLLIITILHIVKNLLLAPIAGPLACIPLVGTMASAGILAAGSSILLPIDLCILAVSVIKDFIGNRKYDKLVEEIKVGVAPINA